MSKLLPLAAALVAAMLSGCTTTADECDPSKDPGFFNKFGCVVSGAYGERVEQKQQQVADLREELSSLSEQVVELNKKDALIREDRAAAQSRLDRLNEALEAMRSKVESAQGRNSALAAKVKEAQDQVKTIKALPDDASILQKQTEKRKLEEDLDALLQAQTAGISI